MSLIPSSFHAYVAEKVEAPDRPPAVERRVRAFREADLPAGDVQIRAAWSSVNFKDGPATRIDGKRARISPLIPGIALPPTVLASPDPSLAVGSDVLAHASELCVPRP